MTTEYAVGAAEAGRRYGVGEKVLRDGTLTTAAQNRRAGEQERDGTRVHPLVLVIRALG
jgi:hypothetical protein